MIFKTLIHTLALIFVAGCAGPFTSATISEIRFKPPTGWRSTPSLAGSEMWTNPKNRAEFVMLSHQRGFFQMQSSNAPRGVKARDIRICKGHPAVAFSLAPRANFQTDGVTAYWDNKGYTAMYVREIGFPANQSAERSLRSLCLAR